MDRRPRLRHHRIVRLDVPFLPDDAWVDFLAGRLDRLASIHFSLFSPLASDARPLLKLAAPEELTAKLARLPGPRKYALLNSRFHAPGAYHDAVGLRGLAALLRRFVQAGVLDGVVYADLFHLRALAEADPELAAHLEAVPSVNCRLDAPESLDAHLAVLARTPFRPPTKVLPDRSLNRRPADLARFVERARRRLPGADVTLLANEGCLADCAFKPAHDALLAATCRPGESAGPADLPFAILRDLGCLRVFAEEPWRTLASPFIRPEDASRYAGVADVLKLCGRNKGGPAFLRRAVEAYEAERFEGNLLELLDVQEELADRVEIPNARLPEDFWERAARCDKDCAACGWCRGTFERLGAVREPGLSRL